jgi:hypothetical protein
MPPPDADGCELDRGEEVVVSFVIAGGHSSEPLEFAKEALDEDAVATEEGAEGGAAFTIWHRLDVGLGTTCGQFGPERIAVVSAVGEQDIAITQGVQHVGSAVAIVPEFGIVPLIVTQI